MIGVLLVLLVCPLVFSEDTVEIVGDFHATGPIINIITPPSICTRRNYDIFVADFCNTTVILDLPANSTWRLSELLQRVEELEKKLDYIIKQQ